MLSSLHVKKGFTKEATKTLASKKPTILMTSAGYAVAKQEYGRSSIALLMAWISTFHS
ncbi:Uncharacterised protein [Chlamydia trachomatis]|nr:Uncharacterised protein [Chlamydia trachomatis]